MGSVVRRLIRTRTKKTRTQMREQVSQVKAKRRPQKVNLRQKLRQKQRHSQRAKATKAKEKKEPPGKATKAKGKNETQGEATKAKEAKAKPKGEKRTGDHNKDEDGAPELNSNGKGLDRPLGCPKCRWNEDIGCKQCKNPSYRPRKNKRPENVD